MVVQTLKTNKNHHIWEIKVLYKRYYTPEPDFAKYDSWPATDNVLPNQITGSSHRNNVSSLKKQQQINGPHRILQLNGIWKLYMKNIFYLYWFSATIRRYSLNFYMLLQVGMPLEVLKMHLNNTSYRLGLCFQNSDFGEFIQYGNIS